MSAYEWDFFQKPVNSAAGEDYPMPVAHSLELCLSRLYDYTSSLEDKIESLTERVSELENANH